MTVDKNITIDLNKDTAIDIIRIHEGDTSVNLKLTVLIDNRPAELTNVSVKYDAVIAGYLAEENADGTVSNNVVSIPITANMTALPGILEIDVRLIETENEENSVLYTKTISLYVDKKILNGSVIIDISGTSLIQLINSKVPILRRIANFPLSSDITVQQLITALGVSKVYKGTATYPSETNHIDGDGYWDFIHNNFFVFYSSNAAGQKWVKINVDIDTGLNHTSSDDYVLSEKAIVDNFVNKTTTIADLPLSGNISISALKAALNINKLYKGTSAPSSEIGYLDGDGFLNIITRDFYLFYAEGTTGYKWVKINSGSVNIDTELNNIYSDDYVLSERAVVQNFTRLTFSNTNPIGDGDEGIEGELRWVTSTQKLFICIESSSAASLWKEIPTNEAITSLLQNYVANNKIKSSYSTMQGDVYDVSYVNSNFAEKQDKTDSDLLTINKSIVPAINEVNNLAKEKQSSKSFVNYSALITYLQNLGGTALNMGQSLYVKTLNVPDLWIYENQVDPKATYVYESDEKFLSDLRQTGTLQIGFYKVAELETQKVDLSEYVETNKIKSAYSTSQGAVYDVTYVNSALTNCIPKISNPDGSVGNGRIVVTKQDGTLNYTSTLASSLARLTDVPTVKSSYSATAGEVYDVTYINSVVGDVETALDEIRGVSV